MKSEVMEPMAKTERWFYVNRCNDEVQEREVISSTAQFVTPVPTGIWSNSKPRKELKGNDWFQSRDQAVAYLRQKLENSVHKYRQYLTTAEANLAAFQAKEGK